ncbi:hypothetical protein MTO96_011330 [Rhipicephalus appendiculatus]
MAYCDDLAVTAINAMSQPAKKKVHVDVRIEGAQCQMEVDSGSTYLMISDATARRIFPKGCVPNLQPLDIMRDYQANRIAVERLQEQLASEKQRSQRLAEREHELEAQLQEAQSRAATLHDRSQHICTELEAMRREKSSLEAKFSAVAVQLAESEAAKQRLYRQKTPASTDESRRLLEQNLWLEQEAARLRHQLSHTVDAMLAPQPRTSTPKKREGPEGQSLHRGPEAPPAVGVHQLEARLRTTLQITPLPLDMSRGSHVDADQSSQGRGDGLGAELERSLQAVAQRPDRLRSESRRLERALDFETTASMASRVASPSVKAPPAPSP